MIMQSGTNVTRDMNREMTVQRQKNVKYEVLESIRGSYVEGLCTYIVPTRESRV